MRLVAKISDRMLGVIAPKVTAAANYCTYSQSCWTGSYWGTQNCVGYNPPGSPVCFPQNNVGCSWCS
ncbi:hypothetical protein GCM10009839_07350 [Catenulispora yoronensis]|uniref:Uncharacterized protein n=1 Tax=Catenulispora yoronensis TaxID=450799 RepID=A0ABP5F295_9ACTN